MFYVVLLPVIASMIGMLVYLRHLRKHDVVLFEFCQLRREIMSFLRAEGFSLSQNDYHSCRYLLGIVNKSIHHYAELKTTVFHLRNFRRFIREYRVSAEEARTGPVPQHGLIETFYRRFGAILARAFLIYTPFLTSEIMLRAAKAAANTLYRIGMQKLARSLQSFSLVSSSARHSVSNVNGRRLTV